MHYTRNRLLIFSSTTHTTKSDVNSLIFLKNVIFVPLLHIQACYIGSIIRLAITIVLATLPNGANSVSSVL